MATKGQVRPDLVGDHRYVQSSGHVHEVLQLFLLPHTSRGIVGGAEYHRTDVIALDLSLHVEEVHALHAVAVRLQGAGDDVIAAVFNGTGEADVGGGVDQHIVASGAYGGQGTHEPAQYAVFVADVLLLQPGDAVAALLPADDGVKVLIAGHKVAEQRVLQPLPDGLRHGGGRGEVHIRHPHGDGVEALVGLEYRNFLHGVHRHGILPPAVIDGGKVEFHMPLRLIAFLRRRPCGSGSGLRQTESSRSPPRCRGCPSSPSPACPPAPSPRCRCGRPAG